MDLDKVDSLLFFCTTYQQPNVPFNQFGGIEREAVSFHCAPVTKMSPSCIFSHIFGCCGTVKTRRSFGATPQGFLESLDAVCCQGVMFPGLQKPLDMGQEDVTRREKACTQPQQLPAFLFTVPAQEETQEEKNHSWHGHLRSALCNTV